MSEGLGIALGRRWRDPAATGQEETLGGWVLKRKRPRVDEPGAERHARKREVRPVVVSPPTLRANPEVAPSFAKRAAAKVCEGAPRRCKNAGGGRRYAVSDARFSGFKACPEKAKEIFLTPGRINRKSPHATGMCAFSLQAVDSELIKERKPEMKVNRRDYLAAAGGALLAGSAVPALAGGRDNNENHGDRGEGNADVLYGHGMVWNRELPGEAGQVKLSFDLRVNLETGAGFGTADDPVHPDWNLHFAINSTERKKLRGGENRYAMAGIVTHANDPAKVGLPVKILAETRGDTTAIAIAVGELAFAGAGLVVIAIIAILIGLLLPAVQKERDGF